jgi:hypothetical protein
MGVGMRHVPSACVAMQVANEMTKVLVAAGKLDMQTRRSWPRQVSTFSFSLDQLCFVLYRTSHESRRPRHCIRSSLNASIPTPNACACAHTPGHHMVGALCRWTRYSCRPRRTQQRMHAPASPATRTHSCCVGVQVAQI